MNNPLKYLAALFLLVVQLHLGTGHALANPDVPIQIYPSRGYVIAPNASVTYSWHESMGATAYDFFIYNRNIPGIAYRDRALAATSVCNNGVCSISPPNSAQLPPGDLHVWRVAAIDSSGAVSEHSYTPFHARYVSAELATPNPIYPSRGYVIAPNASVTYSWHESMGATAYDFFIYNRNIPGIAYRDRALAATSVCNNGVCSISPPNSAQLPPGDLHVWRVAAIDSSGAVSEHSYTPFHARYVSAELATPNPIYPSRGYVIAPNASVTYSWHESMGATAYDFFIYNRNIPGIAYRDRALAATSVCNNGVCSISPPNSAQLPPGDLHVWRVAAIDSSGAVSEHSYTPFHARNIYGRIAGNYSQIDVGAACATGNCVTPATDLQAAIMNGGNSLVLLDGIYDFGVIELTNPIAIRAANLWGAVISGTSYIKIGADDIEISGLKFEDGASPSAGLSTSERHGSIEIRGNRTVLSDNYFENIGIGSTVSDGTGISIRVIESNEVRIRNNVFNNSHSIAIKSDDFSRQMVVANNDYTDSEYFGGAGEVVHFGDANSVAQGTPLAPDDTYNVFTNNYVRNWNLEFELISIKSSENEISNNLFEDCGNSAIVVRMGNRNTISNNVMKGNEDFPIRISGEDNVINENTFCGSGDTVSLHAERAYVEVRPGLFNSYWAAKRNILEKNNFFGYDTLIHYNLLGLTNQPDYFVSAPESNLFRQNTIHSDNPVNIGSDVGVFIDGNFLLGPEPCPNLLEGWNFR